jgi:hypothetical protein
VTEPPDSNPKVVLWAWCGKFSNTAARDQRRSCHETTIDRQYFWQIWPGAPSCCRTPCPLWLIALGVHCGWTSMLLVPEFAAPCRRCFLSSRWCLALDALECLERGKKSRKAQRLWVFITSSIHRCLHFFLFWACFYYCPIIFCVWNSCIDVVAI